MASDGVHFRRGLGCPMTFEAVELTEYEAIPSPGLAQWLDDHDVALACTHTNKVLSVGRDDNGRCDVRGEPFERVTALAAASDSTVWLATAFQLWRLENAVPAGERSRTGDDRFYVPRFAHTVGNALPTDLGILADGTPIFGSITMSCLARPDSRLGLSPVWMPPFVTELAPDRRCYLSGLGMRDG